MIGKLNHVGVATPSIDDSRARCTATCWAPPPSREKFALPEQGVWVQFVNLPNAQIELIEPYGEASPIHGFLAKNPKGGQHHVCFEVEDIIAARDEMRAKGATVLGTGEPRIGAHGVPVIFVHPKDMGGVLVELMETPQGGRTDELPFTAIAIYLTIWWTVLFAVLPLGMSSHPRRASTRAPGCDPGSPVDPKLKRKFITTTWVSAIVFAVLWAVVHFKLIHAAGLPDATGL